MALAGPARVRVVLLTSTGLRHFALAEALAVRHELTILAETPRLAPVGGPAMAEYFQRMEMAERVVFDHAELVPKGPGREWWLRLSPFGAVPDRLADSYERAVVFGASWIRRPLLDDLMALGALNLHMGMAPQYRGTACNFWAAYDGHPEHVGYTVHSLTAGLDAGPILRAATAPPHADPFVRGMLACQAGFQAVLEELAAPSVAVAQDASQRIRYSGAAEFTEAVCAEYLARLPSVP